MTSFQPGDKAIATDAFGQEHEVTIVEAPFRGHTMACVGITFDDFNDGNHAPSVWPLSAVRPRGHQP